MKVCLELPDELVERLADAVAARIGAKVSTSAPMLVGPRDLGVSSRTWRAAIKSGDLKAIKIGRELLASRENAQAWLAGLAVQQNPAPTPDVIPTEGDELDALLTAGTLRSIRGGKR